MTNNVHPAELLLDSDKPEEKVINLVQELSFLLLVIPISPRMIVARLFTTVCLRTFIQCYAPTKKLERSTSEDLIY